MALHADFKLMQARLNHQTWYGSIGAAAACAKLLRLDVEKTRMALGIAANFACGLSANHGSMAGAMAAGNACRNGVVAALMAQEGITANPDIIEAKNGFYDTLVGPGHYDAERMADESGQTLLHRVSGHRAKEISKLLSHPSSARRSFPVVRRAPPQRQGHRRSRRGHLGAGHARARFLRAGNALSGQVQHAATALPLQWWTTRCTLDTFTSRKFEDRGIVETRKKVHLSFPDVPIWPGLADVGPDTEFVGNPVTIRTTDGRSYSARVDIPRGDPALPLTDDELLTKYRDCGRSQLRPDDIERSVGLVLGLEKVEDIGTLMATLGSSVRDAQI